MKILLVIGSLVFFAVVFNFCSQSGGKTAQATYVGTTKCQSCHASEFGLYTRSDHFHAMDSATPAHVAGDFNNSYFIYFGDTTFFYRRGAQYLVRTPNTSHTMQEFAVSYTFGYKPLQQYLVQMENGKIQVLPFCWDTRPKEKGGQRWFHIYGKEKIAPGDELFWTGINQNWNYMCADCHTTNYAKNFNDSSNNFHSTWTESKVSCESCHGPASQHVEWAAHPNSNTPYKGFAFSLASQTKNWLFDTARGIAMPQDIHINHAQIETCARCHARATRFTDHYQHGQSLLQSHYPSTINTTSYYVDGQIREEDYEYGSFLQSKMYAKGVSCTNCHNAHSMQLQQPGNAVCASCHMPSKFDVPAHTHHAVNSTGAQCANCHMPVTTYMVVDDRRDHSIRIPRPDLSAELGTPNACNKCHTDKSVQWASDRFLTWYKDKLPAGKTYGQLMHDITKNDAESENSLYLLLTQPNYPGIIKATALEQFSQFSRPGTRDQILHFLKDDDPLLRLHALKAITGYPAGILIPNASPLLSDSLQSIRMEAMLALAPYNTQLDETAKPLFNQAMNEYMQVQRGMSHRPEGYLNRGTLLAQTGELAAAEKSYLAGLERFPRFIQLYVNLADVYRQMNNEQRSKEYIDRGLAQQPNNADLYYALGLWYIRQKNYPQGITALQKAALLNAAEAPLTYAYALGLYSTGKPSQALQVLEAYVHKYGNQPAILNGLISIYHDTHNSEKEQYYVDIRNKVFGY